FGCATQPPAGDGEPVQRDVDTRCDGDRTSAGQRRLDRGRVDVVARAVDAHVRGDRQRAAQLDSARGGEEAGVENDFRAGGDVGAQAAGTAVIHIGDAARIVLEGADVEAAELRARRAVQVGVDAQVERRADGRAGAGQAV